ncbi:hypothetical protein YPPY61_0619, partial [Yersinia pestis PY-61]
MTPNKQGIQEERAMSQLDTTTPSGDYLMALDAGTGRVRA